LKRAVIILNKRSRLRIRTIAGHVA